VALLNYLHDSQVTLGGILQVNYWSVSEVFMVSNYGQNRYFAKDMNLVKLLTFFARCSVFSHHFTLRYGIHGQIANVFQLSVDVLQSVLFNQRFSIDVSQSMFFNRSDHDRPAWGGETWSGNETSKMYHHVAFYSSILY